MPVFVARRRADVMGGDDTAQAVAHGAQDQHDPQPRELVVTEAHRRSTQLREDLVEGIGVDRGGHPVADRNRPDRDAGLGAPCVRRQVVGQLRDQEDRVVGADRRGSAPHHARRDRLLRVRSAPAELRGLRQPVERLHRTGELHGPHPGRQERGQRIEQRGLAGTLHLCGDDQRNATFDERPEDRRQLRVERAGTDQLDDRARRRWDVADGPPAPPGRGLGHGLSVGPAPKSVKRAGCYRVPALRQELHPGTVMARRGCRGWKSGNLAP